MRVIAVRHDWPEPAGFRIHRPQGRQDYTFLHFITPITIVLGGKEIRAKPGACIFFAPGTPQCFCSDEPVVHNWIHVDASWKQVLAYYGIPEDRLIHPGSGDYISRLFHMIEVEHFSANPYREELIASFLQEFLIRFARSMRRESVSGGISRADRQKLSEVRREILAQPEKRWTVPEMAALAALSPSRFHAVYKTLFGTSPMQDVIEAKMRYAQSLLLTYPEMKLPAMAERLGYTEQYHFLRQFKSVVGVTPGAYRRINRKKQ